MITSAEASDCLARSIENNYEAIAKSHSSVLLEICKDELKKIKISLS
jgi:hypothetical protein